MNSSIINNSLNELVKININELSHILEKEMASQKDFDHYLQNFFECLFSFEPYGNSSDLTKYEQRFYADIISLPLIYKSSYIRDFLKNNYTLTNDFDDKKRDLLLKIYDYYDSHDKDSILKFNYLFQNSSSVSSELLSKNINLDDYFSDRVLSYFNKNDLSRLFRFIFTNPDYRNNLKKIFSSDYDKVLNIISNFDYHLWLDSFDLVNSSLFKELFEDYYNNGDKDNKLSCYISYFYSNRRFPFNLKDNKIESFYQQLDELINSNNELILLKEIDNKNVSSFKSAYFYNIYNISLDEAKYLVRYYQGIEKNNILSDIKKVLEADCSNIDEVRNNYLKNIKNNGLFYDNNMSFLEIENKLNKEYLNSYKNLFEINNKSKIIEIDNNVKIIDAGLDFQMFASSVKGFKARFSNQIDFNSWWNSASNSDVEGLCITHISNENLGLMDLTDPLFGFCDVDKYHLNSMGPNDIWTDTCGYDLYRLNNFRNNNPVSFIYSDDLSNQTRYGYNELLMDKYSSDGIIQPNYIIYYKFTDDYKKDSLYQTDLKLAESMSIPIVLVDVKEVKKHEQEEIEKEEKKLLESSTLNSSLLNEIVRRYMNNYTGSLSMVDSIKEYKEDFSVKGMDNFFNKLIKKIENLSEQSEKDKWIKALSNIYDEEINKYYRLLKIHNYKYSRNYFILRTKFNLDRRIIELKTGVKQEKEKKTTGYKKQEDKNGRIQLFGDRNNLSIEAKTIIDFVNMLDDSSFSILNNYSFMIYRKNEKVDLENKILAYFFKSDKIPIIDNLINNNLVCLNLQLNLDNDKLELDSTDYQFISNVPDDYFIEVLSPLIKKESKNSNSNYENIVNRLLTKKGNIKEKKIKQKK